MKTLKPLKMYCKFNEGIFSSPNMQKAATVIDILLKRSDEQTERINFLLEEVKELKETIKAKGDIV